MLKIVRLHVEGFGRLEDVSHDLSPKLNVLYGPNEAGKSTLLGFIRAVLFGFERQKSPLPRYEPDRGPFGGELLVRVGQDEIWSVRRESSRKKVEGVLTVRGARGEPIPEARFLDALHGIDRELYFQVYAFGLSELASFERLAQSGTVSEALFAVGSRGAQRFRDARLALAAASDALWLPRGQKLPLNQCLADLEDVLRELKELQDAPAEHAAATARLAALEVELPELSRALDARRKLLAEAERLARARADILEWRAMGEELDGLPADLEAIHRGAVEQLEDLVARRDRAVQERDQAALALRAAEEQVARARERLPVEAVEVEVRAALEALASRASQRKSLAFRRAGAAHHAAEAGRALAALGLSWHAEDLLDRDLGAARRAELLDLREALAAADRALGAAEEAARQGAAERDRCQEELQRLEGALAQLPKEAAPELRARLRDVEQVRAARAEEARLEALAREVARRREALEAAAEPPPRAGFPGWLAGGLVLAAAGLAALCLRAFGREAVPVAAATFAVAAALTAALQQLSRARWRAEQRAHEAREAARARALSALAGEGASLAAAIAGEVRRGAGACRALGLSPEEAGPDVLAERSASVMALLAQVEERGRLQARAAELRAEAQRRGRAAEGALDALEEARAERAAVADRIEAALARHGLPPGLSMDRALELWAEAAAVQARLADARAVEVALEAEARETREAEERVCALGGPLGAAGPVDVVAAGLRAQLEALEDRRRTRAAAEASHAAAAAALPPLEDAAAEAGRRVEALLARTGCEDEEALRRAGPRADRRAALVAARREREVKVRAATFLDAGEALSRMEALGGPAAVDARGEALRAEVAALEEASRAGAEELGTLRQRVQALEADGRARALRLREEALRAEAIALADRYAEARLALELLERAKRRYDAEHQPRLLELASRHFSALTARGYRRVRATEDGAELLAIDRDGKAWAADQLSRGTREQLYLAFRLAVISELSEARGPLPLVLDDVLVNFDRDRQLAAVRAFKEMAGSHQVLAFTCHRELAELFVEEGAQRVDIGTHQRSLFHYGTA